MEQADFAFGVVARQAVCRTVKARARAYALRPATLERLHPGLSTAAPAGLGAIAGHLVERERRSPRRWFGFGGEVCLLNSRAALLLGRVERRRLARERRSPIQEPRSEAGVCGASEASEPSEA